MNTTEVMQQALDALTESVDLVKNEYADTLKMYSAYAPKQYKIDYSKNCVDAHESAINALRAAIASSAPAVTDAEIIDRAKKEWNSSQPIWNRWDNLTERDHLKLVIAAARTQPAAPVAPAAPAAQPAKAEIDRLHDVLMCIGDIAHNKSTGPTVPDIYWEIRAMAYEAVSSSNYKNSQPPAPVVPTEPQPVQIALQEALDRIILLEGFLKHAKEREQYMESLYKTLPTIAAFVAADEYESASKDYPVAQGENK